MNKTQGVAIVGAIALGGVLLFGKSASADEMIEGSGGAGTSLSEIKPAEQTNPVVNNYNITFPEAKAESEDFVPTVPSAPTSKKQSTGGSSSSSKTGDLVSFPKSADYYNTSEGQSSAKKQIVEAQEVVKKAGGLGGISSVPQSVQTATQQKFDSYGIGKKETKLATADELNKNLQDNWSAITGRY